MKRLIIITMVLLVGAGLGRLGFGLFVNHLDTPPAGFHGQPNCGVGDATRIKREDAARMYFMDESRAASPENHGGLVIPELQPSEVRMEYSKSELFVCHGRWFTRIALDWHYCSRETFSRPRQRRLEEIAFPAAREIWLSDALHEELRPGSDFPGAARQRTTYGIAPGREAPAGEWTVKPFSEALPRTPVTWLVCQLSGR